MKSAYENQKLLLYKLRGSKHPSGEMLIGLYPMTLPVKKGIQRGVIDGNESNRLASTAE